MSKWKCEICGKEFDNFHAQGFEHKIYCPLCFFKEKTNRLEKENARLKENNMSMQEEMARTWEKSDLYKEVIEEVRKYIEDWLFDAGGNGASMTYEDINELLQILDKIIGDDK